MSAETALAQAAPDAGEGRLSFGEKVGYALGDAACNFYCKDLKARKAEA